ncbi:g6326 [Coccomyxa viridis]|uniref:Malic enzyme n=1 Tax=Coccomyxa viridis TaxID=1274662 RepID=A0ABP1G049_9CHLO
MGKLTALEEVRAKNTDIDKYLYLKHLQRESEPAFYRLLLQQTEEILPIVYTPTVGEACQRYHRLPLTPVGLHLRATDPCFLTKLQAWPHQDVRVVVVTDGERVLGLGDLGAGGMGIAEGKILLYTAAAGVDPQACLPVMLDVGTNNETLLADPLYKGLRQRRLVGADYWEVVERFMTSLKQWQPHTLVQYEDFANHHAFQLLEKYRGSHCCFNDDIQGTACITLAGLMSALRVTGGQLSEQRIMFHGAGEAGTGIAELIAIALHRMHGLSIEEGRKHCIFLDSKGLVCASRGDLQPHKQPFAHDIPYQKTLLDAVLEFKPTALIGVSTMRGAFSEGVLKAMSACNRRPIVFPLSNPTTKAECTFKEAMRASRGCALFASGSPFPSIRGPKGVELHAAQANNAYIFPAIGFAAILTRASHISDDAFLVAAKCLSEMTQKAEAYRGLLFPRFQSIQAVSLKLTCEVARLMVGPDGGGQLPEELAGQTNPDWEAFVANRMYKPLPNAKL